MVWGYPVLNIYVLFSDSMTIVVVSALRDLGRHEVGLPLVTLPKSPRADV